MKQAWILRELPDEPDVALSSVWRRPTLYVSVYGDDCAVFALSAAKVFRSAACAERHRRRLLMPDRWTVVPFADAMLDYEAARHEAAR
jgi:hypothetical protein